MKTHFLMRLSLLAAMLAVGAVMYAVTIKHGPYLQNVTETEATICWVNDKVTVGWVELAPDDGSRFYAEARPRYFDSRIGLNTEDSIHSVKISGLKPGTTYRYRIYGKEVLKHKGKEVLYGNIAATDVFRQKPLTFTTMDSSRPSASFVVVNDIHARVPVLAKMFQLADFKSRDCIIYNGDMVSAMDGPQDIFDGFIDESVRLFAKEKPFYYVRGNHETRGPLAPMLPKYLSPRQQNLYYTFREGPVCFIMLDTGEDKPDSDIEYYGITNYDSYRTEQAEWLERYAQSGEYKSAKYHVVIAHMPPQTYAEGAWHGPKEVLEKFVPTLNKMGIDAMICGHLHRTVYYPADSLHNFPVIVNSNNSYLLGSAKDGKLNIEIRDLKGKKTWSHSYDAK